MLGDAFTAEKPLAVRAAHHGFPPLVVVTSLFGKILHPIGEIPDPFEPLNGTSSCTV
jgi:hypothetical protein